MKLCGPSCFSLSMQVLNAITRLNATGDLNKTLLVNIQHNYGTQVQAELYENHL